MMRSYPQMNCARCWPHPDLLHLGDLKPAIRLPPVSDCPPDVLLTQIPLCCEPASAGLYCLVFYPGPIDIGIDIAGRNRTLVMKIAVVSLLFCLGLVACGQTGPLYLPEPEAKTPSPQTAPEQPRTEQSKVKQSEAEQSGTEPAKASPAASPATTPQ